MHMINKSSEFPESYVPNSIFEMKLKNFLIELKNSKLSGGQKIEILVDGHPVIEEEGKIHLGNVVLREVGVNPENVVVVEDDGKICRSLIPDMNAGLGDVYIYSGTAETMDEVISWAKSLNSIPKEGDVLVINTDNYLRGNYLVGNEHLNTHEDLVELVTPMDLVSSVKIGSKVCRPTNGMIDLSRLLDNNITIIGDESDHKVIHSPQLSPSDSICTWEVNHGLGCKHVITQVYDNLTGNVIYPLVTIVDDNNLRVLIKSIGNIPKEYYTIVIKK